MAWAAKDCLGNCLKGENNCYLHFLLFLLLCFVPFLVLVHISPSSALLAPCPLQLLGYQNSLLYSQSNCLLVDCPCPQELVFVLPAKLIMFFVIELMERFLPARRINNCGFLLRGRELVRMLVTCKRNCWSPLNRVAT